MGSVTILQPIEWQSLSTRIFIRFPRCNYAVYRFTSQIRESNKRRTDGQCCLRRSRIQLPPPPPLSLPRRTGHLVSPDHKSHSFNRIMKMGDPRTREIHADLELQLIFDRFNPWSVLPFGLTMPLYHFMFKDPDSQKESPILLGFGPPPKWIR